MTPAGKRLAEEVADSRRELMGRMLAHLAAGDRSTVIAAIDKLAAAARSSVDVGPGSSPGRAVS